jgi:hypothetical protein
LLVDIIPGDGSGDVARWTARPDEFEADLAAAGWCAILTATAAWENPAGSPPAQTHRYYYCTAAMR